MKPTFWEYITDKNIHLVVIYIIIGIIVHAIIKLIVNHGHAKIKNKKQKTIHKLITDIFKYFIAIIILLASLSALGVNVNSFLAGLGIASVVIGLALKDIMEDILSGITIVLEDKFSVGDYIEINNFSGTVTNVTLRSTTIKNYENTVKIINNRLINQVTNYSKEGQKITIDVPVPYSVDNKKCDEVLENISKRIEKEIENITDKPEILGLQKFEESSITYRILVPVKVGEQFKIKRQINRIIKEEYDKANISIPFNIIEVKNG